MKLSDVAISRPVFTTMMMGALLVLGAFAYMALSVEMFPKVDFPFVTVVTVFPGASAESVETDISKRIEDAVNQISGVRNIVSQSKEGYSLVFIEFQLEKNGFEASNEVREKVAGIRADLPDDVEEPVVSQYDPESEPIISLAISGQRSPREITTLAKDVIKKRLETISGVGSVQLVGGSEREIQVMVNPIAMESYGVTISDVQNAVAAANLEIPGGRIDEGSREYLVRVMGRLTDVHDFNSVIVKNHNGVPVYLSDVARVADSTVEQRSLSRYNGQPAVSLAISKQSGANTVEIAEKTHAVLAQLRSELPPDIKIEVVEDNSTFIKDSIHEIEFNIEFGMLLAVIVLFLFLLDIRPTIIAGLSIPISLIATFTIMSALGFSINMMTLLGLSLSVGILIDDAIVVIENIYRHIDEGAKPWDAAMTATKEIGLAVMATTFSIVVVFIPVAFMQGIVGRFFYQFGMTVAFAVTISLFVAFTLTPMLSSRWLRKTLGGHGGGSATSRKSGLFGSVMHVLGYWNRMFDSIKPAYSKLLASSLRHRWVVMLIAVGSFLVAIYLIAFSGLIGTEFMTQTDEGKVYVSVEAPPGTDLTSTSERIEQIENIVRKIPLVVGSYVTIGSGNDPVTAGRVLFQLVPKDERNRSATQMADSIRTLITSVPGLKVAVSLGSGHGGDKPIEISVSGEDLAQINALARRLQKVVASIPGAIDVDNTQEEGKPELHVVVDRKAADDLGLNLATIPLTVRALVEGEVVTRYKEGTEEYDVRVRLDKSFRESSDEVGRILVASGKDLPDGSKLLVPINRVAALSKEASIGQYNRHNRQRRVSVNANVMSGSFAGTVSGLVMDSIETWQLPPGYKVEPVGEQEIMAETFTNILKALAMAIIFIYLLLASQYESFSDPFSIMLSLPLSLIGAVLGLIGSSFSIMSLIGIVLLMGLVTKNAILLIDFVKQQREKGVSRTEAILIAGPIRLRPILMTTFAMVFGMLPLALGLGAGAELRSSMAKAVVGGIISSTLLTLIVVPVVYTLIEDFVKLFGGKKAKATLPEEILIGQK